MPELRPCRPRAVHNAFYGQYSIFGQRMKFNNQIVVVTGAARGIGLACAQAFAREGAQVVINDLDPAAVAAAVAGIVATGGRASGEPGDVSDANFVEAAVQRIINTHGHIDVLVNNAGIMSRAPAHRMSLEQWRSVLAVNLDATFYWCRAVGARSMVPRRRGVIVNIASIGGSVAIPHAVNYVASKHAVIGLTKALAVDWAQYGVRVNALCPGMTVSELSKVDRERNPQMFIDRERRVPLGHASQPQDQAQAVLFLAAPDSTFVSGTILNVDGGQTALSSGHLTPRDDG